MEVLTNFILNELQNLVVVTNPQGKLTYVNKYTLNLLGLDATQHSLFEYRKQLNHARGITQEVMVEYEYNRSIQAMDNGRFEKPLKTINGNTRWIMWNVSRSGEGNFVGIGYDITDKKLAELALVKQSQKLEQQQKDVISSIQYAQRIQESVLPDLRVLEQYFTGAFALYRPRDYVSGDFYWTTVKGPYVFIAVADSTGHGVPGAMMAVMGNSFLNNAVKKFDVTDCDNILHELDREIQSNLNQRNNGARDGMDISLVRINTITLELQFSGAMRSALVLQNGVLRELKASKYPLGFFDHVEKQFENIYLQLSRGDILFLHTDGYTDQFGGERDKKFNKKQFRELLPGLADMNPTEQEHYLDYVLQNWKQQGEQTDDITVVGLTV